MPKGRLDLRGSNITRLRRVRDGFAPGDVRRHLYDTTEQTMLRAAMDFCSADIEVQRRTRLLRELRDLHPDTDVCYLPVKNQFREIVKRGLPSSKWCQHCKRLPPEAVLESAAEVNQ